RLLRALLRRVPHAAGVGRHELADARVGGLGRAGRRAARLLPVDPCRPRPDGNVDRQRGLRAGELRADDRLAAHRPLDAAPPEARLMAMPAGVGIIDLMLGIPSGDEKRVYDFMRPLFRDQESLQSFDFPVQYMFKDFPKVSRQEDYIGYTLQLMDKYGIEKAMIGVSLENAVAQQALKDHPYRFFGAAGVDPNH